jgi:hypothetical protein
MTTSGRRRLVQAGVAALLVAPTVLLVAGRGGAAPDLGNYNGTVSSTAVHVQAGSSAFPNFNTGAVDNHYPLAVTRLDSSPNVEAFSSPLDTGPLGQTIAGAGHQNQPQYADVRCPPQCDDKPVTVGSQPGPFSSAQAADRKAMALGQAGGASLGGGAPAPPPVPPKSDALAPVSDVTTVPPPSMAPAATAPGFPALDAGRAAALRSALLDWRARYLTADDARRYPMPAADAPDGIAGDSARSEGRLDGSTLVLDGTSSVGRLVLGGGALVLRDVSVHVNVINDGTPKKTVVVNVGEAMVGGTPVTIGADGVSVNGQAVPGIGGAGAQASAALNQALGRAGVEVRSLAPSQNLTDHQLTLDAVGVLIRLAPASPAPGVPAQFMAMAVGEVFADSLAVPGGSSGELDDGLGGDLGGGTGPVTPPPAEAGAATPPEASAAGAVASGGPASASDVNPVGNGASFGSSGSSGSYGAALGSAGGTTAPASSAGRSSRLASPASARRVLRPEKPTKLLLLYLLWQSLVIGTVASLYLWRKAAAA